MNKSEQKSLLVDLNSSKLKLPNIRRVRIDGISDGNKELNLFFQNWVSSKLYLLWVNHYPNNETGIKMDFYVNSISKAIKSVSKEIFLNCFEIKESELEQIIKSISNWERLIFSSCDIHCLKKLDFSVSARCKIKFLGFIYCGHTWFRNRKIILSRN